MAFFISKILLLLFMFSFGVVAFLLLRKFTQSKSEKDFPEDDCSNDHWDDF